MSTFNSQLSRPSCFSVGMSAIAPTTKSYNHTEGEYKDQGYGRQDSGTQEYPEERIPEDLQPWNFSLEDLARYPRMYDYIGLNRLSHRSAEDRDIKSENVRLSGLGPKESFGGRTSQSVEDLQAGKEGLEMSSPEIEDQRLYVHLEGNAGYWLTPVSWLSNGPAWIMKPLEPEGEETYNDPDSKQQKAMDVAE